MNDLPKGMTMNTDLHRATFHYAIQAAKAQGDWRQVELLTDRFYAERRGENGGITASLVQRAVDDSVYHAAGEYAPSDLYR
jgi:hypothetical protein